MLPWSWVLGVVHSLTCGSSDPVEQAVCWAVLFVVLDSRRQCLGSSRDVSVVMQHVALVRCGAVRCGAAAAAPDFSEERAMQAVAAAMADILLNIAEQTHGHRATVFLATLGGGGAPPDGTNLKQSCHTEEFRLLAFTVGYVLAHRAQYTAPRGNGLLLFLLSALYTKTGSAKAPDWGLLLRDMDCKDTSLVVEHGYCGQELVNLLLFGRAVSNVFDGVTEIGEGPDVMALQGVPHRSRAGYLTLMEHFGNCRVGERLKDPVHPVWVVCSESHYTVLFAKREGAAGADEASDLWYWDQLGMQDEEIRLSVDPSGALSPSVPAGDELVPPIDDVIRTKWPGATICGWGGGGMRAKKKFVSLKWASLFRFIHNFIFPQRQISLVFGGWVVWPGGVGVRQIIPPPSCICLSIASPIAIPTNIRVPIPIRICLAIGVPIPI